MAYCPNKNLEEWKLLVSSRGEDIAYYLWDKYEGNVPEIESKQSIVKAGLKAIQILNSDKAKQIFDKGNKNNWSLEKILAELAVPREQRELIKGLGKTNLNEIVTDLLANYSYTIEINTAKEKPVKQLSLDSPESFIDDFGNEYTRDYSDTHEGFDYFKNGNLITKQQFDKEYQDSLDDVVENQNTQYYSNLTVPGGTNYTENEIATPAITPSIKGHAQFATDKGIGWFRSDDKENKVVGWKEEDDFLNSETAQYNPITKDDKIIFGHPGIGKTYLKESGRKDIIDFDSDYKTKINEKFNLPKGFKARNDFQKSNKEEYQKAVRELWIEAKQEAKRSGRQLFASDMILLREFANDFDKVITMSKDTFVNRAKQRNDYTEGETEKWKTSLDAEISKIDKSKVINTDKYLSDLLEGNPKTRRILEVQSDLYQKSRDIKSPDEIIAQLQKEGKLKIDCN